MAQHANCEKNLEKQLQLNDDHLLLHQKIKELKKKINEKDTCIYYLKLSIKNLEDVLTKFQIECGRLQQQVNIQR